MAEYIKREAAIRCVANQCVEGKMWGNEETEGTLVDAYELMDDLSDIPAADVSPVVRCKGCEHAERYERADGGTGYYCGHPQNSFTYGERWNRVFKPVKEANDFCSYGAKMDGGVDDATC